VVVAILGRSWNLRATRWNALAHAASRSPRLTSALLIAISFAAYALVARFVFSASPLHLDEIAQVVQARIFARGRLFLDTSLPLEFTSALHILDTNGKWVSQFPPGWPLLLTPGVLAGAPWLTGPVAGSLGVGLFWGVLRRGGFGPGESLGGAMLYAATPFVVFMSGSMMNHTGALLWALAATYALLRVTHHGGGAFWSAIAGFTLGMLATVRPVDAVAFAAPAGMWLASRAIREPRRLPEFLASGAGLAIPVLCLLWYNSQTTGSPLLFAYDALWGPGHGLGFHEDPWGGSHTPLRGLELLSLYFLRLQTYLFESPVPSLLLVSVGFALCRSELQVQRYWLHCGAILCALYFAYWHDGFYLGPRFLYPLVPLMVVGCVLAVSRLWQFVERGRLFSATFLVTCLGIAVASGASGRARQYSDGLTNLRVDATEVAQREGVRDAVVFVRESWGAQMVSRMWALGVTRSAAEGLYRSADACQLETVIGRLEVTGARGDVAAGELTGLRRKAEELVPSPWSPDQSERYLPGTEYSPVCQRRVSEDRQGFTLLLPILARDMGSNVYVRDLHEKNVAVAAAFPRSNLYLLTEERDAEGVAARPVFRRLSRDSALVAWGGTESR
jgi:hypothetical protein